MTTVNKIKVVLAKTKITKSIEKDVLPYLDLSMRVTNALAKVFDESTVEETKDLIVPLNEMNQLSRVFHTILTDPIIIDSVAKTIIQSNEITTNILKDEA